MGDREPHRRSKSRVGVRLAVVAVGAVVVSGAVVAILNEGGEDDDGEEEASDNTDPTSVEPANEPDETSWNHRYPEHYVGPVWITVETDDGTARNITITWGPWQRKAVHDGAAPLTYLFRKDSEDLVTVVVDVEPPVDADVTFGHGDPPNDGIDVNAGWVHLDD